MAQNTKLRGKDLTGQKFGRLTAIEPLRCEKGKGMIWLCKCDCGGEKEVLSTYLLRGRTQSCGCIKAEKRQKQDITNQRFGRLVAIAFQYYNDEHKDCWLFRCDCGNEKIMPAANVKWSGVKSCGCLHAELAEQLRKQDITGRRYGRLRAVRPTEEHDSSGSIIWECLCDCGKTVYHSVSCLSRGGVHSCGCLYRDSRGTASENRRDAVEGTLLSSLISSKEPRADNSSGHTGVCYDRKSEKWQAYINFQKKRYFLGGFSDKFQAIRARKEAEKRLHDPIIQEQWDSLSETMKHKYIACQKSDDEVNY